MELLIQALNDKDKWIRYHAAEALSEINDPGAIDPLIETLDDERFASYAAYALSMFKHKKAKDALKEYHKNKEKKDQVEIEDGILKKCGGCGRIEDKLQLVRDKKKNRGFLCETCKTKYKDLLKPESIRIFWMCNACNYRVLAGTEIDIKVDTEFDEKCPHCNARIIETLINLKNDSPIESSIIGEALE